MKRLALIFSIFAIFFAAGGLVVSQTVKQNRDEIVIIQNKTQLSVLGSQFSDKSLPVISQSVTETDKPITDELNSDNGQLKTDNGDLNLDKLSVNDATLEELDTIPGVGLATAQKIIDARPWGNLEEALKLISSRYRDTAREKLKL